MLGKRMPCTSGNHLIRNPTVAALIPVYFSDPLIRCEVAISERERSRIWLDISVYFGRQAGSMNVPPRVDLAS
jgi:hypothetical protein